MAIRPLVTWPDSRLKFPSGEVVTFDRHLRGLYHDLVDTMRASDGLGIAAPQIGNNLCVFVVSDELANTREPVAFVNPRLDLRGSTQIDVEMCLSFPGSAARVERYEHVYVEALNLDGERFSVYVSGLYARCVQHEYDHLTGKVLADYGLVRVP